MEKEKNNFESRLKFMRENLSISPFALKQCFIKLVQNVIFLNKKIDHLKQEKDKPEEKENNSEIQMLYDNIQKDRNELINHTKELTILKQKQEELKDIVKKLLNRLKEVEEQKPPSEPYQSEVEKNRGKIEDFVKNNKEFSIYDIIDATGVADYVVRKALARFDNVKEKERVRGNKVIFERIDVD